MAVPPRLNHIKFIGEKMLKKSTNLEENMLEAPLGKASAYITQYTASLLFPISRKRKRDEIGLSDTLPFYGFDTWNAYEVSWLDLKGKPIVAIIQFDISCSSVNIIESKSFKLYLNSFNNTKFNSIDDVQQILERDITHAVEGEVDIKLFKLADFFGQPIENFAGESELLDDYELDFDTYEINPSYLSSNSREIVEESLASNLLKSNCLVTGQPDWGSIQIKYTGPKIDKEGLLRYIVSFRNHNEFHEQCVERIFMDVMNHCKPETLTVEARYTRRGGLDINPVRSTGKIMPAKNIRMPRQ